LGLIDKLGLRCGPLNHSMSLRNNLFGDRDYTLTV
jgi:hypothetical protein